VETNVPLDASVFQVEVPPGFAPLTLEELRRAGPLGESVKTPDLQLPTPNELGVWSLEFGVGS
jgi:hypothetical protein